MEEKSLGKDSRYEEKITSRTRLAFATGEIGDNVAYQTFSFLIFTFYFTVVGLSVLWISLGFIIWSFWNAINNSIDLIRRPTGRNLLPNPQGNLAG